jgi:zinc protease
MMRTIQKRYYVPNNSVLVVTGDVNARDVFAEADALYATWKQADDPFAKYPLIKHPPIPKTEALVVEQPVQSYTGTLVYHGPSTVGDHVELTYAADLLAAAIAEPSSKFQKQLVDSGACVSAGMSWYTQMNTGPITVSFEAAPDNVDACVKAVVAELPQLKRKDYLSDEELKNAAHSVEVLTIKERERLSSYAHTLTFWWTSAGLDYYLRYLDNIKKVTRDDLAKYLDAYVIGRNFVFGSMVSPEMKKSGLDKSHFEKLVGIGTPSPKAVKP